MSKIFNSFLVDFADSRMNMKIWRPSCNFMEQIR